MMPLEKVMGGNHPKDLRTKSVSIGLAKKHMKTMGIRLAKGRAEASAQQHSATRREKGHGKDLDHEESWAESRVPGSTIILREHSAARMELYTPSGSWTNGCPDKVGNLSALRKTVGRYASGKEFVIEDNWKRPERAHREFAEEWTGHAEFFMKVKVRAS